MIIDWASFILGAFSGAVVISVYHATVDEICERIRARR